MKDQEYIDILISQLELRDTKFEDLHEKAKEVALLRSGYEESHPEIRDHERENMDAAKIQYRGKRIKDFFASLPEFGGDPDKVPEIPTLPIDFLRKHVWPGLIRAGAIPKKDLVTGKTYIGKCKNSSESTWDGEKFWYGEKINHFQDDDGHDVFVPIKEK